MEPRAFNLNNPWHLKNMSLPKYENKIVEKYLPKYIQYTQPFSLSSLIASLLSSLHMKMYRNKMFEGRWG